MAAALAARSADHGFDENKFGLGAGIIEIRFPLRSVRSTAAAPGGIDMPSGTSLLYLNDPAAHGYCHRLCAIAGVELLHDVFDMNFDGFL
jgi:hypothetical protein